MTDQAAIKQRRDRASKGDFSVSLGLATVVVFFVLAGFVSYWNTRILNQNSQLVARTHDTITAVDNLLSTVKDAETGQRGYVMTGRESYLVPYNDALARIDEQFLRLEQLTQGDREQSTRIPLLKGYVQDKLKELGQTIELRRDKGFQTAVDVVLTDRGKNSMDAFRALTTTMREEERTARIERIEEMERAYRIAIASGIITGLLGVLLSCAVAYLIWRAAEARRRQEWLQLGQVGLAEVMIGELKVEQLGQNILDFLARYFGAHVGTIFVREIGTFRRAAGHGLAQESRAAETFRLGDGLLGQAAKDGKIALIHDVPEGYMTVQSSLGQDKPRHLIIAPVSADGKTNAVVELGFMHPLDDLSMELLKKVSDAIGIAVRSAQDRANLQNLLEETQRQSEELQAQGEELRVSNEELEEQSRALKESQARLEQQQIELEQTNSQLEEQTQILETQRDDLTRTKNDVQLKAQELERASQYKSDFLANMSHELRTPLNSSLILAKLLADNPNGNLSEEQVKFAQTIQASGNDLLALINDILDLSKIEAGHMDIRAESVLIERLTKDVGRVFEPMAKQRGLAFNIEIAPGTPASLETDRQRLEQILKNLLSNALKFTQEGSVTLLIQKGRDGSIDFAVRDTGIGIAKDQQGSIFQAFQQADGTISRKYGGTGLGLSISRQLARLLGGRIMLESEINKGSTFTLSLPEVYSAEMVQPMPAYQPPERPAAPPSAASVQTVTHIRRMEDDREILSGTSRVILVIEDDESFARILSDMAHELSFQCLIATTAEEGLILTRQYLPHAVLLDVGLPDNSGLSVLDRLKRDVRTRHIPVHVISAGDYMGTALSLGAVGYMLKPVKREELVSALRKLETAFAQKMRRVLIVEDDAVQLESISKLLGSHDVQTVGASTAAECLNHLKNAMFDCMVLDLTLPDASGYALLETLSREDAYSFPPAIVYTARDLSADEEQKLRRYSKSIIIKGAKSPERLLDEVTLFLHQVVSELPAEQQRMLEQARNRDAILEGRRILIVEDDVANVYALTSILEPRGAVVQIARNGREAVEVLEDAARDSRKKIDLVLMDVMMPEVDGLTATRQIRQKKEWKKLPIIMLTAKAMKDDQERCLEAGANDYMAKPLDVEKLLSLVRVWMPR